MIRYVLVGLALIQTACPYNYGSHGELGRSTFDYGCLSVTDPACDCEDYLDFCLGYPSPIEGLLINGVPERIALGARFWVGIHGDDDYPYTELYSASPAMLSQEGSEFVALQSGEVALISRRGGMVIDFIHLQVVEPTRVRIERVDVEGPAALEVMDLELAEGTTAWLRATLVDSEDHILYGSMACAWSVENGVSAEIGTPTDDNVVEVVADATGTSSLQVVFGQWSAAVGITVPDASELDSGGAP
jgi:hypothetical protein